MGSTHYFVAYVAVNGSYPPLRTRIDPGDDANAASAENHDAVVSLMHKVQTVGHKDRPAFAPRITIDMAGGNVYRGEYQGNELGMGPEHRGRTAATVVPADQLAPPTSWKPRSPQYAICPAPPILNNC